MGDHFLQSGHGVRFEWGPAGAEQLAREVDCLVVVDVLSFTTSVSVAAESGTRVFPYPWRDRTAEAFAWQVGAELAVGRREAPWSLSPAALRRAPSTPRLVLPSPNGPAISAAAKGSAVVAACLRNATAVAEWLAGHGYGSAPGRAVGIMAAGERWPDGGLRPAVEDLLGAGAVIASLRGTGGCASLSPEARTAAAVFSAAADVAGDVRDSVSGRELVGGGFSGDVSVATEVDACPLVPVLTDGFFAAAPR